MNKKRLKSVFVLAITGAVACWIFLRNASDAGPFRAQAEPDTLPQVSTKTNDAADASSPKSGESTKGLTAQEMVDKFNREVAAQGGPLQVWKNRLKAAESEANQIPNIRLTPEAAAFFDKAAKALYEWDYLVDTEGAQITSLAEAKQACVVFVKQYSLAVPARAAFHNDTAYFMPAMTPPRTSSAGYQSKVKIPLPDDFSVGWAIKFSDKKRINVYRWNFNKRPPEDGVLGIKTELE